MTIEIADKPSKSLKITPNENDQKDMEERLKHLKEEIKEIEEEILLGMQIEKETLHKCIHKTHPFTNL